MTRRILHPARLLRGDTGVRPLSPLDGASWLWAADVPEPPPPEGAFLRFRLRVRTPPGGERVRIDVTADERFVLLLDGAEVGRGPHRCVADEWLYQSYELRLAAGCHALEAVVWRLGASAPAAQVSVRGGFALAAEGAAAARFSTGAAPWRVARLRGTRCLPLPPDAGTLVGTAFAVDGASVLDETPPAAAFAAPVVVRGPVGGGPAGNPWCIAVPGWRLYPSPLPDQMRRECAPGRFLTGPGAGRAPGPFDVPARSKVSVLWDLGDYFCAFPDLAVDGGAGAVVRWGWAEALRGPDGRKTRDRGAPAGGAFVPGVEDAFRPGGRTGARFSTPWWRSGRFCRLEVETAERPLRVRRVGLVETRLPVRRAGSFACDDATLGPVQRLCVRGLEACMHETFVDCPHYEQLMYVGDTRVQILAAAAAFADDRLPLRAAALFDRSRRADGILAMHYPSSRPQESAAYALVWPLLLRDCMRLFDCRARLRALAPGMRHALHGIAAYARPDGLLEDLPGWSFVDWAPEWAARRGVPPGGLAGEGASAPASFFHALALQAAAEIDAALGEPRLAAHWRAGARRVAAAAVAAFWDERRGLLADDEPHTAFSEHAQCLALLAGALRGERRRRAWRGLLEAPGLARSTVYFSHYLFEAFLRFGRTDLFLRRLDLWRDFAARGLRTPLESPDGAGAEPRSDCHAWGSHPLWHLHAGVAGVRPDAPFYARALVAPQPGPLRFIRSATPTPRGPVKLDLRFDGGRASGVVELPPGLPGTFRWAGRDRPLPPGRNEVGRE